jgi:serine/threonine-protein kinase
MLKDLEEILAVETARTGQATGEVTTVLRTLPGDARRRIPWRMRHPLRWAVSLALLVAIVTVVAVLAAGEAHRGAGQSPGIAEHAGVEAVQLGQAAAHDYNPFGTGPEDRDLVGNLVDGDPNTTWSTEQYYEGTLKKAGGTGLGVYLDAAPHVLASSIEIQTPTPGFAVQIYVADHIDLQLPYGDSTPLTQRGWQGPVGASTDVHNGERVSLELAGHAYRYYLVWLTTLPPGMESAALSELTLFS